jgi:hypothetical protein
MAGRTKYSLWLVPDRITAAPLATIINRLARQHGGPRFEPHVTLLGGLREARADLLIGLYDLAGSMRPLALHGTVVATSGHYYLAVYLKLKASGAFETARARARRIFRAGGTTARPPHVSLLYGDLAAGDRRALRHELRGLACSVRLRAIRLVRTTGPPSTWRTVRELTLERSRRR